MNTRLSSMLLGALIAVGSFLVVHVAYTAGPLVEEVSTNGSGVYQFKVDGKLVFEYNVANERIRWWGKELVAIDTAQGSQNDRYLSPHFRFKNRMLMMDPECRLLNPSVDAGNNNGSPGDIVLCNNANYRAVNTAHNNTVPLMKMTKYGVGLPEFGRFKVAMAANTAARIGNPKGLLIVYDDTDAKMCTYRVNGNTVRKVDTLSDSGCYDSDGSTGVRVWYYSGDQSIQVLNREKPRNLSWALYGLL